MAVKTWIGNDTGNEGDFDTAANWSPSGVPATGDQVIFDANALHDLDDGLTQSSKALTIKVYDSFTFNIGSATTALTLDTASTADIGVITNAGSVGGSSRIWINFGDTNSSARVFSSSSQFDGSLPPIQLVGGGTNTFTATIYDGSVAIAGRPGETSKSALSVCGSNAYCYCGSGVTISSAYVSAGELESDSGQTAAAVTVTGNGVYTYTGTGAHTALTSDNAGAKISYNGTGNITTLRSGHFNGTLNAVAKTITTWILSPGFDVDLRNGNPSGWTVTNGLQFQYCEPDDGTLHLPDHMKLTPAAL